MSDDPFEEYFANARASDEAWFDQQRENHNRERDQSLPVQESSSDKTSAASRAAPSSTSFHPRPTTPTPTDPSRSKIVKREEPDDDDDEDEDEDKRPGSTFLRIIGVAILAAVADIAFGNPHQQTRYVRDAITTVRAIEAGQDRQEVNAIRDEIDAVLVTKIVMNPTRAVPGVAVFGANVERQLTHVDANRTAQIDWDQTRAAVDEFAKRIVDDGAEKDYLLMQVSNHYLHTKFDKPDPAAPLRKLATNLYTVGANPLKKHVENPGQDPIEPAFEVHRLHSDNPGQEPIGRGVGRLNSLKEQAGKPAPAAAQPQP